MRSRLLEFADGQLAEARHKACVRHFVMFLMPTLYDDVRLREVLRLSDHHGRCLALKSVNSLY